MQSYDTHMTCRAALHIFIQYAAAYHEPPQRVNGRNHLSWFSYQMFYAGTVHLTFGISETMPWVVQRWRLLEQYVGIVKSPNITSTLMLQTVVKEHQ